MKILGLLICVLTLLGCRSEVDKCTDAIVKMHEPYRDAADRSDQEGVARLGCLKAASGKQ
jgi:hypothetical protein